MRWTVLRSGREHCARFRVVFAAALVIVSHSLVVPSTPAQEPERDLRRFTVTAGLGNPFGWVGAQGEIYFAREHLPAFVGLGYTPAGNSLQASGPTFAVGTRVYAGGAKHRGFAELSISQVMTVADGQDYVDGEWVPEPAHRLYGPGLQLGYQYASFGGFTVQASAGVGYAATADETDQGLMGKWWPMAALGFGYTWR